MDNAKIFPAIVWLKVTNYMHAWLDWELCGSLHVKDKKVVSVQDIPGAREILRMETVEEVVPQRQVGISMSATWRNCIEAGMSFDPATIEKEYGVTKEGLKLFVPIECPKMCLTKNGVLRPWTLDVNFSHRQASSMQRLIRDSFWKAVEEYSEQYARKNLERKYAQVEMIEDFCSETNTPDIYIEAIRREWQRRLKRVSSDPQTSPSL